ncbi:MAG TPA: hypothetical protein VMV10_16440 [Pirellulales bacterium]|nr:hypothetical protein [Pirellulales bacterium]
MVLDSNLGGPRLNIDPTRQPVLNHRSGWAFALEALAPLHDPQGILFDSFIERTFSWFEKAECRRGRIPYREPWLGVFHNPPGVPRWHDYQNSPQAILARGSFRESLPNCLGMFTLSKYLADWLSQRISVPVCALVHPTDVPRLQFSQDAFLANPQPSVIQVGWWLRRLHSIFQLRAGHYRKLMLAVSHRYFENMLRRERSRIALTEAEQSSVATVPFVSNDEYDQLLSRNVVFCHLIDSSANNAVIECIVRNTPLLVNRLPAIEEYLGRDYPLYFSTLEEASAKLARLATVLAAHEHLCALPKDQFSQRAFCEALLRSDVYRKLCGPAPRPDRPAPRRRAEDNHRREPNRDLSLTLARGASGAVFVERAEFRPADERGDHGARQILQSLLSGLPMTVVRQLTLEDFIRRSAPGMEAEAKLAYDALKRALDGDYASCGRA